MCKNEEPFIKTFKTPGGHYVYDVNTNALLKVDSGEYKILSQKKFDTQLYAKNPQINLLRDSGYLSSRRIKHIRHPATDFLEFELNHNLGFLTLQVTQACNLRCEYCPYTSEDKNRGHKNLKMDFPMVKKCIDFLLGRSRDKKTFTLGFYGGEPLMEIDLIKKAMDYAIEKSAGKELVFSMTTNGTLLNERIGKILADYKVLLIISLDGPERFHDKGRKFASKDRGTHQVLMEKLQMLQDKYPEYYSTIRFNTVLDPQEGVSCINDFFIKNDQVNTQDVSASLISDLYQENLMEPGEEYQKSSRYEIFKVMLKSLKKLPDKRVSPLYTENFLLQQSMVSNLRVKTDSLPDSYHHGGPCVPGVTRLFVSVNGDFYPCEKASEESKMMRIGNIETGFDLNRCREILNVGTVTEDECKDCWAVRFCTQCAVCADDLTSFCKNRKLKECGRTKKRVEESFKNYCAMQELGERV